MLLLSKIFLSFFLGLFCKGSCLLSGLFRLFFDHGLNIFRSWGWCGFRFGGCICCSFCLGFKPKFGLNLGPSFFFCLFNHRSYFFLGTGVSFLFGFDLKALLNTNFRQNGFNKTLVFLVGNLTDHFSAGVFHQDLNVRW